MALDVTECPIQKPLDYHVQEALYSGKAGMHTLKYEIGSELNTGLIVWFHGSYLGSIHDLSISRLSKITQYLKSGEVIMADKAYIGEPHFITPFKKPVTLGEIRWNSVIYQKRIIVENSLRRIKIFGFTQREWRHSLELHAITMKALVNILNIDIKFRPIRK
jgi:hypothetical protein